MLASSGVKVEQLIGIFNISYKTIYNWINRWESEGIVGLYNKPGRGRKRIFNPEQESKIREWAKEEPRQLKKTLQKVKEEWDIEVSTEKIKRILRKFYMRSASDATRCWRRAKLYRIQREISTTNRV
jgi:transposase